MFIVTSCEKEHMRVFIVTSCAVFKEPAGVFQRETTSLLYSGTTKQEAAYVSVGVYYDGKSINITSTIWLDATDLIDPLHDPVTWYKKLHTLVSKLRSGTSKTKAGVLFIYLIESSGDTVAGSPQPLRMGMLKTAQTSNFRFLSPWVCNRYSQFSCFFL